jgi:hypothetical protein
MSLITALRSRIAASGLAVGTCLFVVSLLEPAHASDALAQDSLLIQMGWEPAPMWGGWRGEGFGHLPEFTLYSDGLLVYVHRKPPPEEEEESVRCVRFSPAGADSIWGHVLGLGVEQLESYESHSKQNGDVASITFHAGTSVIRVRTSLGKQRTIRNYGDYANDPAILSAVRTYLLDWSDPLADAYLPPQATLVIVQRWRGKKGLSPWPLESTMLTSAPSRDGTSDRQLILRAFVISGANYELLTSAATQFAWGFQSFECEGSSYMTVVRPWLPGEDFSQEIKDYEPSR